MGRTVIDWLRRERGDPAIELAGRRLPIEIRRHPRARRMILRLAPEGEAVRVTVPRWARTADALEFVHSRNAWLEAQLAAAPLHTPLTNGCTLAFRGRDVTIAWRMGAPRSPALEGEQVLVGGPESHLSGRIQRWLEGEALRLMADDLSHFCCRAGVTPPSLRLSRARRRWGSCTHDGTVRINWRLVMAPDRVRRSVVAHEVAHLLHFDHGPQFKAALARIYDGDLAAADRWLKDHGRSLYTAFG